MKNKKFFTSKKQEVFKMLRKRGSHVGVILSFVIFIVFLIFLFSALQPALKIEKDKEATLEYITNSIIELSSDNMTIENIEVDNSAGSYNCVSVKKIDNSLNFIVKDYNEFQILYQDGDKIIISLTNDKNFLKIYYSKSINDKSTTLNCVETTTDYLINLVNNERIIFISKFEDIINRDYDLLKKDLGIGRGTEFSFNLLDANKIIIVEMKTKDVSANVYVNEFPVLYSNGDGEIKSGFINVRVW